MKYAVGDRIMILRKRNKLSKKELADMIGVTAATISNYERGATMPSVKKITQLATALNVPLGELISVDDPKKPGVSQPRLKLDDSAKDITDYHDILKEYSELLKNKSITIE